MRSQRSVAGTAIVWSVVSTLSGAAMSFTCKTFHSCKFKEWIITRNIQLLGPFVNVEKDGRKEAQHIF